MGRLRLWREAGFRQLTAVMFWCSSTTRDRIFTNPRATRRLPPVSKFASLVPRLLVLIQDCVCVEPRIVREGAMSKKRCRAGFTLVELLVVISILLILSTLVW